MCVLYHDFQGYLLALGMSRTAQVKRDARIGEAEAGRDSGIKVWMPVCAMDDSSYRRNFDLDKKNEIHYHSWKEHLKMSKIAKFGCELL
jgi:uncharacterized membrane protein YqiK